MTRICLAAMLLAAMAVSASAQVVWNSNSPRAQRDLQVNPPSPQAAPGQVGETVEVERWGTQARPWPQPQWGTLGGTGWGGVTTAPR